MKILEDGKTSHANGCKEYLVKIVTLPKAMYRFSVISIKFVRSFFTDAKINPKI